jgi:hypothetical protein
MVPLAAIGSVLQWSSGAGAHPIDALWSPANGVFATSPALYLAAIGLIPLWRRDRRLASAMLTVFAVALAASTRTGPRAFVVVAPFFVCGMTALLDSVTRAAARRPAMIASAALGLFVLWNVTLMAVTRAGGHRIGEPVSFGDLGAAQAATLHDWIGHPASYPANLIHAVRYGVAPGRYDALVSGRLLADSATDGRVDIGGGDTPFLEDGWHGAERDGSLTFRWARREADLIVSLDRATDLRVTIQIRAFAYPGAPPQSIALIVNGHPLPRQPIGGEWQAIQLQTPRTIWRRGVNRVVLHFDYEARPSETGQGGDGRQLAAAVDGLHFAVR